MARPSEPSTTIVICGASGDLTQRKLIPSLFNLYCKKRLPKEFHIVGFAFTEWKDTDFRAQMRAGVQEFEPEKFSAAKWDKFAARLFYVMGSFTEAADFAKLKARLAEIEPAATHRLYYLATPPRFFAPIVQQLGAAEMVAQTRDEMGEVILWRRVIIEKPFGIDLASAEALNRDVHAVLDESQIYRIDHYLAKETVQNLLVFRFANTIFEPIWNRNYIDHVQITAAETVDVGHRAGYYDQAGVLRDMFQNHLLQLLSLVSMEPPASFDADAVRDEKVKLLRAVRPIAAKDLAKRTVRAQYTDYLQAPEVAPNSQTPTYAAIELYIDNWRWRGVPFYLRSGKAMAEKDTEIIIQFKEPPHLMFPLPAGYTITSNLLAICIQPHEGIHLRFEAKVPDTTIDLRSVDMNFHYDEDFAKSPIPEAYERLLLNALDGDATLFARSDGIVAAWRIIDPIIAGWETKKAPPLVTYERGSWGPAAADALLQPNCDAWYYGCAAHQ